MNPTTPICTGLWCVSRVGSVEDGRDGTRVAGARSASWDMAFALQALAAVEAHASTRDSIARGVSFLTTLQYPPQISRRRENFRIDPRGGWCFAGVWHGWPVSDCTAEALLALLAAPGGERDSEALREGVEFILRRQNADGGFGSYEQSGTRWSLEWLNPAEMFAELDDRPLLGGVYLVLYQRPGRLPGTLSGSPGRPHLTRPRARRTLVEAAGQRPDGAWPGAWGVYLIMAGYSACEDSWPMVHRSTIPPSARPAGGSWPANGRTAVGASTTAAASRVCMSSTAKAR